METSRSDSNTKRYRLYTRTRVTVGRSRFLPVVSKDCERVVYNQFAPFLTSEGRLSNNQSGNKKFYSTETSVIETTDMMDNKNLTAMVLLDMSKAFDSVDHKLMISKLQDAGASSSSTKWFRSYLSDRQKVFRF